MKGKLVSPLSFKVSPEEAQGVRYAARQQGIPLGRYLRIKLLESSSITYTIREKSRNIELKASLKRVIKELNVIERMIQ
jgi:hypothetical protein